MIGLASAIWEIKSPEIPKWRDGKHMGSIQPFVAVVPVKYETRFCCLKWKLLSLSRIKVPMVLRLENHENGLEFCRFGLGYPNL